MVHGSRDTRSNFLLTCVSFAMYSLQVDFFWWPVHQLMLCRFVSSAYVLSSYAAFVVVLIVNYALCTGKLVTRPLLWHFSMKVAHLWMTNCVTNPVMLMWNSTRTCITYWQHRYLVCGVSQQRTTMCRVAHQQREHIEWDKIERCP
jgi:hypothetical protein